MSNIAIFKSGQTPQYLTSVNTPDYSSDPDVLIEPDISLVKNVALRFWKRNGNLIAEMSQAEKDIITAAELQARKEQANDFGIENMKTILTALIKVINIRLSIGQKITKQEMVDALKGEII